MIALAWLWGLIWLGVASLALWPLVNKQFAPPDADEARLIRWPLTIGLSLGALTLWMLAVGLWRINVWAALAFPALVLPLSALSSRSKFDPRNSALSAFSTVKLLLLALRRGNLKSWLVLAGLIALAVVLGQATYFPFIGDDEISRYAYYARFIFTQGRIGADVRGYPMLMALSYAYVFFVTGQLAEQLARLIPVLFSVAAVIAVADEDEAIHVANDTPFGLGASIWTKDVARGEKIAARIEAGAVFVNGMVKSDPRLPFGGIKGSGYGRELSAVGIREFMNVKTVVVK